MAACNTHSGKQNKEFNEKPEKGVVKDSIEQKIQPAKSNAMYTDTFECKTDTLIQQVMIKYLSKKTIQFNIKTFNRYENKFSEFADTAAILYGPGPGVYMDELNGDEVYPAQEFIYNRKGNFVMIGIDDRTHKRLLVDVADESLKLYNKCCPFKSLGTLRKIHNSKN